jgi:O-antigen/teichoic acid export membrane protein
VTLTPLAPPAPDAGRLRRLGESPTVAAAGLAAAAIAANLFAVVATVVFTRLLGTVGYGSLAALLNLSVILLVPGAALQVAAARDGTLGRFGEGGELAATLQRWTRRLVLAASATALAAALARHQLAAMLGIEQEWAAAAVPVTAWLWVLLSLQRGLLQATRAYRAVGLSIVFESAGRVAAGIVLVEGGLGVTGAYLGTPVSALVVVAVLGALLGSRLGAPDRTTRAHPLRALASSAALPIAALLIVAALQNVDVILASHALPDDVAGVYAAATVAAKALVWIAIGVGMWLLPEAVRRAAAARDPRPVLGRALALIAVLAVPALAAFAAAPSLVLRTAFGADYESGDDILLTLGVAYALLAFTYLAVQFLLGMDRRGPLWGLAAVALAEPLVLAALDDSATFAAAVLAIQAIAAVVAVGSALWRPRALAAR